MVRLEEVPSNALDGLNLRADDVHLDPEEDADMEDLYDRAAARGGLTDKTFEEALSDLSSTPLFMTSLKDAGGDENVGLEALRALQYEGTKSEAAQNFKEQGNECVQVKHWIDAREFYNKGIAVLQDKNEARWEKPEDLAQEQKKRFLLSEQLYSNRARCNLELSKSAKAVVGITTDSNRELSIHNTGLRQCAQAESIQRQSSLPIGISPVRT